MTRLLKMTRPMVEQVAMRLGGKLGCLGLAALALTIVASCGSDNDSVVSNTSSLAPIQVEADMFSGRPNPSWRLDVDQSREVVACLSAATLGAPTAPSDALGFRAFSVTGLPARLKFTHVRVSQDSVIAYTGQEERNLTGCDQLYTLLRSSASSHMNADELDAIPKAE